MDELIDAEAGVVSREIFVNESVFQSELTHLFSRAWLLVYLGDFHWWLDNLCSSASGELGKVTVARGVQKWRIRANWKFVSENFLGDNYHGPPSHASVDAVGIGIAASLWALASSLT